MTTKIKGDATSTFGGNVDAPNVTNTPMFHAILNATQTVSSNVNTKVQFNDVRIDTDSAFDSATNYRFTVPSGGAGKYWIGLAVNGNTSSTNLEIMHTAIMINGDVKIRATFDFRANYVDSAAPAAFGIFDLAEGDYVEGYGQCRIVSGSPSFYGTAGDSRTWFTGYRLIG